MKIWFLIGLTGVVFLGSLFVSLMLTPLEVEQGLAQKIFYFHVPSAFTTYLFLLVGTTLSIFYLVTKNQTYNFIAKASMYTSTLFACLVIGSGPLWARPIWGVYWTWDPRLTLTFILFVLLIGYCFIQQLFGREENQRDKAALIGSIVAVLALPFMVLTHFSVKLWRGLHPSVISNKDGLPPEFQNAFELGIVAIFLLGSLIAWTLYEYLRTRDRFERVRVQIEERLSKS